MQITFSIKETFKYRGHPTVFRCLTYMNFQSSVSVSAPEFVQRDKPMDQLLDCQGFKLIFTMQYATSGLIFLIYWPKRQSRLLHLAHSSLIFFFFFRLTFSGMEVTCISFSTSASGSKEGLSFMLISSYKRNCYGSSLAGFRKIPALQVHSINMLNIDSLLAHVTNV